MAATIDRRAYPTDLTDAQWALLDPWLSARAWTGRPRTVDLREVVNAVSICCGPAANGGTYRTISRTGAPCATTTISGSGTGPGSRSTRRCAPRTAHGWGARPSPVRRSSTAKRPRRRRAAGSGDTPAAKKVVGRKRFVRVDTEGHTLGVRVVPADWSEQAGGRALLAQLLPHLPRVLKLWAVLGDRGDLGAWLRETFGVELEIVTRPPDAKGFVLLARRWVVERTLAWWSRNRRLAKEYEHLLASRTLLLYLAAVQLLLQRLAPHPTARRPYAPPRPG
jgi:transposase